MVIRRRDFSAFLVHLTRDYEGAPARENLLAILQTQVIEARNPFGIAIARLNKHGCATEEALESQYVACFSETPLEDLSGLIEPGIWRRYDFRPYGLVFSRDYMLAQGANPVWYINMYSGPGIDFRWLSRDVNNLIASLVEGVEPDEAAEAFLESPLSRLTPFIGTMGSWQTPYGRKTKDYSFEREWRHAGDFDFSLDDVEAIITPPEEQEDFKEDVAEAISTTFADRVTWRALESDEVLAGEGGAAEILPERPGR